MCKTTFDINPHVIRQLGAELVTDHITALMELIKNSYDADANYVNIVVNTKSTLKDDDLFYKNNLGYITIDDDGFGMTQETLLKSWLIISYSGKRAINGIKPKTPKGRTPLGDKGLGRLSTQCLAQVCEIYTKSETGGAMHVGFDWNDFDIVERLAEVNVKFQEVSIPKPHGTKLVLSNLVDSNAWKGASLERFKALLCQLISPVENKPFRVFLNIDGENIDLYNATQNLSKLNVCNYNFWYADGHLHWKGTINMRKLIGNDFGTYSQIIMPDNGKRFLDNFFADKKQRSSHFTKGIGSEWLGIERSFNINDAVNSTQRTLLPNESLADPGPFSGRIQEFSFIKLNDNSEWWDSIYKSFDEYKSFVQNQKGIKIYRNGFAVRPYGIDGKDWLSLGDSQTGGSSYYGLRPANVIGYVVIDEADNCNLKDKTDREGFYENDYYRNFEALLKMLTRQINEDLEILRRYYNDFQSSLTKDNHKVKSMKDAFETILRQSEKGTEISNEYNIVQKRFENIQSRIEKVVNNKHGNLFTNNDDPIVQQTLQDVAVILSESKSILVQANDVLKNSVYLDEALKIIKPRLETLESQLSDFSELASLGLISEMVSHDLVQISSRMLNKGIELEDSLKRDTIPSADRIYETVLFIKSTVTSLKSQVKHLDSSMKYNKEKKEVFSVAKMIFDEEFSFYKTKTEQFGIKMILNTVDDFEITMNKGKLIQVFDNLINNSLYWIKSGVKSPEITVTVDKPWIYFEDNGHGIVKDVENILFEPFITRKPQGEGRGLGLFIIQQLLDSYNCDIVLDQEKNTEGNRYRFSINMTGVIDNK